MPKHERLTVPVETRYPPTTLKPEWEMQQRVGHRALDEVLGGLSAYTDGRLSLTGDQWQIIKPELWQLESAFLTDLVLSHALAQRAHRNGGRINLLRASAINEPMRQRLTKIGELAHKNTVLWMAGGLLVERQGGGLKEVAYVKGQFGDNFVHDLSVSAATARMGFGNPYPLIMRTVDSLLRTSGHPMFHYHPSETQGYALEKLAALHPNKKQVAEGQIRAYTRHSGSEINTVVIEVACAHAAKKRRTYDSPDVLELLSELHLEGAKGIKQLELMGLITVPKVFAVDGTWAGGHSGAATEATSWRVDEHGNLHTGGEAWVKRVLPLFTPKNRERILAILSEAIAKGECAGLIIEPDVIVDAGMYPVDQELLAEVRALFEPEGLPIIADCIQTTGSDIGTYFGDGPSKTLQDYPHLIITNAKAAAVDPYAFALIPAHIDGSTTPGCHLSTPTNYGPHLQALVIAEMVQNPEFQAKVASDAARIRKIAKENGMEDRLRGKGMNLAWIVDDAARAQNYLYIKYGIMPGKASGVLRDQRAMTEFSATHDLLTRCICRGLQELESGHIDSDVEEVLRKMSSAGGL